MLGDPYFIYVSSDNRIDGNSHDFIFTDINFPITNNYDRVSVVGITIPKSWYLIDDDNNNFIIIENSINKTITISNGNYDLNQFLTELTNKINAVCDETYDVTINLNTGKLVFTITTTPVVQPTLKLTNSINKQLGFEQGEYLFSGNILTSVNVISLQKTEHIKVFSNIVPEQGILVDMAVSDEDFTHISYFPNDIVGHSRSFKNTTSNFWSFKILDFNTGNLIDLNGLSVSMSLIFFRKDRTPEIIFNNNLVERLKLK